MRGPTQRDPMTGISLARQKRSSEVFLTDAGHFRVELLPDCDLFCVSSLACTCGFSDAFYFETVVLEHPDCPIHCHRLPLLDDETGEYLGTIYATAANSAQIGGQMWHQMKRAERQARTRQTVHTNVSADSTKPSSGCTACNSYIDFAAS